MHNKKKDSERKNLFELLPPSMKLLITVLINKAARKPREMPVEILGSNAPTTPPAMEPVDNKRSRRREEKKGEEVRVMRRKSGGWGVMERFTRFQAKIQLQLLQPVKMTTPKITPKSLNAGSK